MREDKNASHEKKIRSAKIELDTYIKCMIKNQYPFRKNKR